MHKYLKAIGFSDAKLKKEEDALIKQTIDLYTDYDSVSITEEYGFAEYCKEYGDTYLWNVGEEVMLSAASAIQIPVKTQFCVHNADGYLIMTTEGALYHVNLEDDSFLLKPLKE